ncbi:hypothetical protein [Duganella sp. BJB476]|uniref:hypothetical protein n=1 Tax=Duganella sp. BJB476 TaxID=1871176 RepID=UPI000E340B02|nr:hypothetical protein [Duganella sp. BJB476]RFP36150.1 hypothetical protein D0T21_06865 [Duganella sp. BJB476]
MASKTLGRVVCPIGCGHTAAQVKLKTDKEAGKTAYPYVHCAGCGIQLHTRGDEQAAHLLGMTRPEGAPTTPAGDPLPVIPLPVPMTLPAPPPVPPAPKKQAKVFDGLLFGSAP